MKRRDCVVGFTLVELIIAIVVVGVLAIVTVPQLINKTTHARAAAMNAMGSALNSTVSLAKAADRTKMPGSAFITLHGQRVMVAGAGYPTGSPEGIGAAVKTVQGFSATYGATTTQFDFTVTPVSNCNVTYTPATGNVVVTTSGC